MGVDRMMMGNAGVVECLSLQHPIHFPAAAKPKPTFLSPIIILLPTNLHPHPHPNRNCISKAKNGSNSPAPKIDCPVPFEQQPINEYLSLSTSFPFSWASGDLVEYCSRLFVTGASFALFIGLPVAWFGAVGPDSEPLKRIITAVSSGVLVDTLAVVRMYLGWAYVGNRLLSATVEYEETGWYDGQVWVKTAEVLTRDRLLGSFTVKPVLSRLKVTLVSLAASLFLCTFLLINIDGVQKVYNLKPDELGDRAIPGVYSEESARSFEPESFCGESGLPELPAPE